MFAQQQTRTFLKSAAPERVAVTSLHACAVQHYCQTCRSPIAVSVGKPFIGSFAVKIKFAYRSPIINIAMFRFASQRRLVWGAVSAVGTFVVANAYYNDTGNWIRDKIAKKVTVAASWTTDYTQSNNKWDDNWDKRDPQSMVRPPKRTVISQDNDPNNSSQTDDQKEKLQKMTPKCNRHLFLIRHGQYNTSGATDEDCYLTKLGQQQAEITGLRLKELGIPYTAIVKSTMTRATETATLISKFLPDVPVSSTDLLREGAPIPPEPPVGSWRPKMQQFHTDGARIEAAFRKYFHRAAPDQEKDSYDVVVCHANVIRYFVCRALQLPPEAWLRISLAHASITWIVIRPSGRVILKTLGDSGHMPPDKISYT